MADPKKTEAIVDFRHWLCEHDVNYQEHGFGHFHIFNDSQQLLAQVWPTTELLRWQDPSKGACQGIRNIHKSIEESVLLNRTQTDTLRRSLELYKGAIQTARLMIIVMELDTGALETQINNSNLINKYHYMMEAYDEHMKLKKNPEIRIVDFIIV